MPKRSATVWDLRVVAKGDRFWREVFFFGGSNKKVEIWGFPRPFLIFPFRFGKRSYIYEEEMF